MRKNIFLVSCKCGDQIFDGKEGNRNLIKVMTHDGSTVNSQESAVAWVKAKVKHKWPDGTEEEATDVLCVDGPVGHDDPRVTPSPLAMAALAKAPKAEA